MRYKIAGVVLVVFGVILSLFSQNISEQVAEGRARIAAGQGQVDTVNSVFSQTSVSKPFGKMVTGSAQNRIDAGTVEANEYDILAGRIKMAGIAVIILGIALFFFSFWKRKLRL